MKCKFTFEVRHSQIYSWSHGCSVSLSTANTAEAKIQQILFQSKGRVNGTRIHVHICDPHHVLFHHCHHYGGQWLKIIVQKYLPNIYYIAKYFYISNILDLSLMNKKPKWKNTINFNEEKL